VPPEEDSLAQSVDGFGAYGALNVTLSSL
jgi:hypothetical protein